MIFGPMKGDLISDIFRYRIVSIVGYRGAGKDLLSSELAMIFLEKGYRFWSNQFHIWNDDLYGSVAEFKRLNPRLASIPLEEGKYPLIRRMVVILSEAGRYLRQYAYFEDMFEFARKFDQYYFFPSVRPPHEDLQTLLIYPSLFQFGKIIPGVLGGLWRWKIQDGLNNEKIGSFYFVPDKRILGIYDTEDPSSVTQEILEAVREHIEIEQRARGRDGVQGVEESFKEEDSESLKSFQRRIYEANKALLSGKKIKSR